MKKYIAPALDELNVNTEMIIAGSIASVGGNSNLQKGEGETPEEADAKRNVNSVQWESWEDQEDQEQK